MTDIEGVEQYIVNGFQFDNRSDYEAALQEKKGIVYLNGQTDISDTEKLFSLYKELIDKRIFSTPVGIEYLRQIRNTLIKNPKVNKKDVPYVYVVSDKNKDNAKAEKYISRKYDQQLENLKKDIKKQKDRKKTSIIINIILGIMVITMFIIASTTSNANIINYERVIQDKYAGWAEELTEKEAQLNDLQKKLEEQQKKLDNSQN